MGHRYLSHAELCLFSNLAFLGCFEKYTLAWFRAAVVLGAGLMTVGTASRCGFIIIIITHSAQSAIRPQKRWLRKGVAERLCIVIYKWFLKFKISIIIRCLVGLVPGMSSQVFTLLCHFCAATNAVSGTATFVLVSSEVLSDPPGNFFWPRMLLYKSL